jgi:2-polyprenyl-3-methyl-5-hydroxy-6-metoxy-1,4-benzoquinol methylase
MLHTYTFAIVITLLYICDITYGDWMFQSEQKWDQQWKSGAWDYMDKVAVERSKIAIIGGVFAHIYTNSNASVLDMGCGEGAMSDFLSEGQKQRYLGVDLSKEAIVNARLKRPKLKFLHSGVYQFVPHHQFDIIVFSDVLYYVEHEKILQQYSKYLTPTGIIILSIFHTTEKIMYENIFNSARNI